MGTKRGNNVWWTALGILWMIVLQMITVDCYPLSGLSASGLGLHQKQPSYLPDYNGIFSLHALNFTPAAIDKTQKFLQVLTEDNALIANVSLSSFLSTKANESPSTLEERQQNADGTTDRLPDEVGMDYFNEVDSGHTNVDVDSGNSKADTDSTEVDVDSDTTEADIDSGTTKVDSDTSKLDSDTSKVDTDTTTVDSDSGSTTVDEDTSTTHVDQDSNNLKIGSGFDSNEKTFDPSNTKLDANLEEDNWKKIPSFHQIHVMTKTIKSETFLPSTTPERTPTLKTEETTKKEDTLATTVAEVTTFFEGLRLKQSNSSDALLSSSGQSDPVETDGKPDIFDNLMNMIQGHWTEFVGKMKLSVLDVWKSISQHMMERLEHFASAL